MAIADIDRHRSYRDRQRADLREYWLIFCLAYPLLLVAAVIGRIGAAFGHHDRPPESHPRSVFAEAREAAAACIPFALR